MIKETSPAKKVFLRYVSERKIYSFFKQKGYTVCNATPFQDSHNWFAVLTKNKEFIIATVFTKGNEIEYYEESVIS